MKKKLTSRKLWVAIAGIIASVALIISGNTVEGTTSLIASIFGYLVAEGLIDAKAVKAALEETTEEDTNE